MPSKAVAVQQDIHPVLASLLEEAAEDTEDISWVIAERILSADTAEDIFAESSTLSVEQDLGFDRPFWLHKVEFRRSRRFAKEGEPDNVFALLTISQPSMDSPKQIMTCGATNVMAQAKAARDKGMLPKALEVYQSSKATAAGYFPLWMREAGTKARKLVETSDGQPF